MLKRFQRIRLANEYKSILKKGQRYYSKYFIFFVLNNSQEKTRFGFIASKKVGGAVVRNASKRRLREIVRKNLAYINFGVDAVFIISPELPKANHRQLTLEVKKVLKSAGLLRVDLPG